MADRDLNINTRLNGADQVQRGFDGINLTTKELKERLADLQIKQNQFLESLKLTDKSASSLVGYQRLKSEIASVSAELTKANAGFTKVDNTFRTIQTGAFRTGFRDMIASVSMMDSGVGRLASGLTPMAIGLDRAAVRAGDAKTFFTGLASTLAGPVGVVAGFMALSVAVEAAAKKEKDLDDANKNFDSSFQKIIKDNESFADSLKKVIKEVDHLKVEELSPFFDGLQKKIKETDDQLNSMKAIKSFTNFLTKDEFDPQTTKKFKTPDEYIGDWISWIFGASDKNIKNATEESAKAKTASKEVGDVIDKQIIGVLKASKNGALHDYIFGKQENGEYLTRLQIEEIAKKFKGLQDLVPGNGTASGSVQLNKTTSVTGTGDQFKKIADQLDIYIDKKKDTSHKILEDEFQSKLDKEYFSQGVKIEGFNFNNQTSESTYKKVIEDLKTQGYTGNNAQGLAAMIAMQSQDKSHLSNFSMRPVGGATGKAPYAGSGGGSGSEGSDRMIREQEQLNAQLKIGDSFATKFGDSLANSFLNGENAIKSMTDELKKFAVELVFVDTLKAGVRSAISGESFGDSFMNILGLASSVAATGGVGDLAYAGAFADGGIVPGNMGQPRLAVVHGGEAILNPNQQAMASKFNFGSSQHVAVDVTGRFETRQDKFVLDFNRSQTIVNDRRVGG